MNNLITKEVQMTSLELAETTGKEHKNILRDIRNEIEALGEINELIFEPVEYFDSKGEKRPCYKFGRKGAMQLALKYDAKTRYKVIEKLEELESKNKIATDLSPQLQLLINMELKQKQLENVIEDTKQEVKSIRDVITINPKAEWRKKTNNIIKSIGFRLKDYETPRNEAYEALKERAGCRPSVLINNLKKRALKSGMAKSKVDKLNILDVLENEPRLKEIYITIVKEMAIKYGV